jgi:hypothetical protein
MFIGAFVALVAFGRTLRPVTAAGTRAADSRARTSATASDDRADSGQPSS